MASAALWATTEEGETVIAIPLHFSLRQAIERVLEAALAQADGNNSAAARALGLHRRTLQRMQRKAGR